MNRKESERATTAYHEAGHAVAAMLLGIKTVHVTIRPDHAAGSLGHHRSGRMVWKRRLADGGEQSAQIRARGENHTIYCLAGSVAENIFRKKAGMRKNHAGARADWNEVADIAVGLFGDLATANAFVRFAQLRAEGLMFQWWSNVEAVAKALLEQETLTGDQVRSVIQREVFGHDWSNGASA